MPRSPSLPPPVRRIDALEHALHEGYGSIISYQDPAGSELVIDDSRLSPSEQRALAADIQFYRKAETLDPEHLASNIRNFIVYDPHEKIVQGCTRSVLTTTRPPKGIYIFGKEKTGKSHLAIALAKQTMQTYDVLYLDARSFSVDQMKPTINQFRLHKLLVIDNLDDLVGPAMGVFQAALFLKQHHGLQYLVTSCSRSEVLIDYASQGNNETIKEHQHAGPLQQSWEMPDMFPSYPLVEQKIDYYQKRRDTLRGLHAEQQAAIAIEAFERAAEIRDILLEDKRPVRLVLAKEREDVRVGL